MKEFELHRHNDEQKKPDAAARVLYDSVSVAVSTGTASRW